MMLFIINKIKKSITLPVFICLIILTGIYTALYAESNYGTTGAQILDMYSSARLMGMGNAGVGLVGNVDAVIYNPAALSQVEGFSVDLAHAFYFNNTSLNSVSMAYALGKQYYDMGLGFKWKYFTAGDTIRDVFGNEGSGFDINFSQYALGAGIPVYERHSLGLTINTVTEKIYDESGNVISFNLGWMYNLSVREYQRFLVGRKGMAAFHKRRVSKRLNAFGAVIKNIGGEIATKGSDGSKLPLEFAAGGTHELLILKNIMVAWELFTG
ncbi:hypothetical protein ACFLTD_05415, partial [Elusimicrobiota bacterium]